MSSELGRIDRDASVALHEQIRRSLLTGIWRGFYQPGDLLPSEKELSDRFSVNRLTVRRALHALANQGHVRPLHGRGYQVKSTTLSPDVLTVVSLSHFLESVGIEASTRLLDHQVVDAEPEVADALGVPRGDPVVRIRRLRCAAETPIVLDEVFYDARKFGDLVNIDLENLSLVDVLFKEYDLRIGRVSTVLEAAVGEGETAELLELPPHAAVLSATTIMYDLDDRPVEYGRVSYHGNHVKLTFTSPVDPASWPYGAKRDSSDAG